MLVSPTAKFVLFALFITVVVSTLFYLLDMPLGYGRLSFVVVVSVLLYVLLEKIADKLRRRTFSP